MLILAMNLGILLGYILGDILSFTTGPMCLLMITNIFLAGAIIIHDSPMYLLRRSRFRVSTKESQIRDIPKRKVVKANICLIMLPSA